MKANRSYTMKHGDLAMDNTTHVPPVVSVQCGAIQASAWINTKVVSSVQADFPSVKISKSYTDKNTGEWKTTYSFSIEDLPKVALVATEIYRYFRVRMREPGKQDAQGQVDESKQRTWPNCNSTAEHGGHKYESK